MHSRFYFTTDARTGWGSFGSPGVASAFRQRGIGTVLWHMGLDHLRRSGCRFAEYGTGLNNPAQHLYFHSGATLMGIGCEEMLKRL
jgi:ribosomal protein S18 acetylase RimI-like enzyme